MLDQTKKVYRMNHVNVKVDFNDENCLYIHC